MKDIINKLILAADQHGEDDLPDHTVGDLQDLLREAWSLMTVSQKQQLLASSAVEDVVEAGARREFEVADLEASITAQLADMEVKIRQAGYDIRENDYGFFWERPATAKREEEASEDFPTHEDAVVAAFHDNAENGN